MNNNALNLKSRPHHQAFKPAPRAIVPRQGFSLRSPLGLERCHSFLHVLGPVLMRHKNRVRHRDRNDVLQANAYKLLLGVFGAQQSVMTINRCRRLRHHHAVLIRASLPPDSIPAT